MNKYFCSSFIIFSGILFATCEKKPDEQVVLPETDKVKVHISWNYRAIPLEMELYEPASQRPLKYWDTGIVNSAEKLPVSEKISGSEFYLKPGAKKLFVLALRNNTDKPVYFFAAPHSVKPEEYGFGFKFKCLCINKAFMVNPGEYWYRAVELKLAEEFKGENIEINHTLIGITENRMKELEKSSSEEHQAGALHDGF